MMSSIKCLRKSYQIQCVALPLQTMVLRTRTRHIVTQCANCSPCVKTIFSWHRGYLNAPFSLKYNSTVCCKNPFVCVQRLYCGNIIYNPLLIHRITMTYSSVGRLTMRKLPAVTTTAEYTGIIILPFVFLFYI